MDMGKYYWRCLKAAFSGWLGLASTAVGIVTVVLAVVANFCPFWSGTMKTLMWAIPLAIFGVTIIVGLILSPYLVHRRDEKDAMKVKQELEAIRSVTSTTPKLPHPPELEINYMSSKYGIENGIGIITVWAEYRPNGKMRIEQLEMHILGRRIPSLDWKVMEASQDLWFTSDNKFELPSKTSPGKHDAELFAFANGEWWRSHSFSIEVKS